MSDAFHLMKFDPKSEIIAFMQIKGGTGKTTLATNIAAMRAMAGKSVLGFDLDGQKSAVSWAATRNGNAITPPVRFKQLRVAKGAQFAIDALNEIRQVASEVDTVVLDVGGSDNPGLRTALFAATMIIVPYNPGQFDIWGLDSFEAIYLNAVSGTLDHPIPKPRIVCNRASSLSKEWDSSQVTVREGYGDNFDLIPKPIFDRIIFRDSLVQGHCVSENRTVSFSASKARIEIASLYESIFGEPFAVRKEEAYA